MEDDLNDCCRATRYVSEEYHMSREQAALAEMAYRLCSSNVVGDHEDVGSTRREARLLMSLSAFPQSPDQSDLDLLSSSETENSYMSDSSSRCSESFSIVCPSLSLENSPASTLQHAYREKRNRNSEKDADSSAFPPAKLLGRPLHADDRNAVRLSADAMALNVCDSFRKALQWRINRWTESLSKSIAAKEQKMLSRGASTEQLKKLLSAPESTLILSLNLIEDRIKLTSTRTRFTVLPQRVEKSEEEPSQKKRRTMSCTELEESEYLYSVAHAVRFECVVELDTPAGFVEVTLEVPGSMLGTFISSGIDQEHLSAVTLDLNTDMLAVMVEKCCRQVVRVSLESVLKETNQPSEASQGAEETKVTETKIMEHKEATVQKRNSPSSTDRKIVHEFATPPPSTTATYTSEEVRAAIVSPQLNSGSPRSSPPAFLSPIPDDLDAFSPRRISPQPKSAFKKAFSSHFFTPQTPKTSITNGGNSVLVSPSPQNVEPSDNFYQGTSLPVLVEVACRAFRDD